MPHAPALEARREKTLPWVYGHVFLYAAIAAVGAGPHVIGYSCNPRCDIDVTTLVASIAVPVIVFMIVRLPVAGVARVGAAA